MLLIMTGDDAAVWAAIDTLYVIVAEKTFLNTDPALTPEATPHAVNVRSDVLKIEVVGADEVMLGTVRRPMINGDAVAAGTFQVWFLLQEPSVPQVLRQP